MSVVQTKLGVWFGFASGTPTTTFDAPPTEGNVLLAVVYEEESGTATVPGFTMIEDGLGSARVSLWVKTAGASEPSAVTASWAPGTNSGLLLDLMELTGSVGAHGAVDNGSSALTTFTGPSLSGSGVMVTAYNVTNATYVYPTISPNGGLAEIHENDRVSYRSTAWLGSETFTDGGPRTHSVTQTSAPNITGDDFKWAAVSVIVPGPPPDPKITFTIGAVELTGLVEKSIRVELDGPGEGHFIIPRGDVQATAANLARGNICKVTVPEIDPDPIFEFFIETGDFELISSDEEGGQDLQFGGPGTLAYLDRARMLAGEYATGVGHPEPGKGSWYFTAEATEGAILDKIIDEAQDPDRPWDPIPLLTKTFTDAVDSDGASWAASTLEGAYRIPIGQSLLDAVLDLVRGGLIHVEMAPGMVFNAYRDKGVDRSSATFATGKVRFVAGVNIAGELVRQMAGRDFANHALVKYGDGYFTNASAVGTFPYDRETFIEANTDSSVTAQRIARGQLGWREAAQEALLLSHITPWPGDGPDDAAGIYLPGPPGSANGRYWVGDLVTVHTGSGEFDYANATHRVHAITLTEDGTGYLAPPIVELNAPFLAADESSLSASPIAGTVSGGGGSTTLPSLTGYQQIAEKGVADGYASLDASALVPVAELPVGTGSTEVAAGDHTHGGGGLDDLSDVTLTMPASADRLRFDGSVWRNSALRWTPVTTYDGTNWMLAVDGSGNAIMSEA